MDTVVVDKILENLGRIISARMEFPTAIEQVEFELDFTDNIQELLVVSNQEYLRNFALCLTLE
jgi:hypothetical protein